MVPAAIAGAALALFGALTFALVVVGHWRTAPSA
jgi:hypothetical protein